MNSRRRELYVIQQEKRTCGWSRPPPKIEQLHRSALRTPIKLANQGLDTRDLQACPGHRNIQNTTRDAALAPDRFKEF